MFVLTVSGCSSGDGDIPGLDKTTTDGTDDINYDKMTLVWNDEFDGTAVNTSKWNYRAEGTVRNYGIVDRRTIALDGKGNVEIKVLKDEKTGKYYIGELGTDGIYSQTYGYFECRAKMNRSLGAHVSFWLQSRDMSKVGDPAANGTEIDVFEYHRKTPDIVYHNLHWNGYGTDHQTVGYKMNYPDVKEGFHTFGLKWTPTEYIFYVDGKKTWSTKQAVSHHAEYFILSTELTGWGGDPALGTYPDAVVFDYVRAYQFK
jgi:beta-glucanase (GH16 family)